MEKLIPFQIGKRNLEKENHWEKLDINKFCISKPTLLCFGGNRTMDCYDANAFCKCADKIIRNYADKTSTSFDKNDFDIIGFAYGHYNRDKNDDIEVSSLSSEEKKLIAERIFFPLFLDKNGRLFNKDAILRNFNMITIFSHSYGSIAVNEIINIVFNKFMEFRLDYRDIQDIFSQIISVSYAPRSVIAGVSNIQIISGCDGYDIPLNSNRFLRNLYYSRFYNIQDEKQKGSGVCLTDENTISLLTTNMTNEKNINDHVMSVFMRGIDSDNKENSKNIFKIAESVLSNSISNSISNFHSKNFVSKIALKDLFMKSKIMLGSKQLEFNM